MHNQLISTELKEKLYEGLKDLNKNGCINMFMDLQPRPYFDYKDMQTLINRVYEHGLTVWGIDCMLRDDQNKWYWDMTEHADDYPDEDINKWFLDAFNKMVAGLKLDNCLNYAAFYCSIAKVPEIKYREKA
jgi:hypothetical protein